MIRTRFAPSPTGDLHVGGAWTALASWAMARAAAHGQFVVRVDLDRTRVVSGAKERILADLAWLGLAWDELSPLQSTRGAAYAAAIAELEALALVYPCDCSRSDIARAASAPHAGEEAVYPGTCRALDSRRTMRRPPALRLRIPDDDEVVLVDGVMGPFSQRVGRDVGDFVLRRGDGVYSYQLAVMVDDLAMGATDVVRGVDLLASTPRQILLARLLGREREVPRYWHLPLVVASDGTRLAKRTRGASVGALREGGVTAAEIVGELARGLGIGVGGGARGANEVALAAGAGVAWGTAEWRIPEAWAEATR